MPVTHTSDHNSKFMRERRKHGVKLLILDCEDSDVNGYLRTRRRYRIRWLRSGHGARCNVLKGITCTLLIEEKCVRLVIDIRDVGNLFLKRACRRSIHDVRRELCSSADLGE